MTGMQFLTDEHVSPAVASRATATCPGIRIAAIHHWQQGRFLGATDEVLLTQAAKEELTLLTYDLRTIAPLLKLWAETGVDHGGVVFVDHRTIPPQDIGGLIRAICRLWKREGNARWRNRVVYLR